MRFLLAALVFLTLCPSDADACSCVERSFAEHAKNAKRVMLVRAGKPVKTGDALAQTFTVLATLKGPTSKQFVLDRPATPPCASNYRDGEIALLFPSGGDLDPCYGNVPLDEQISQFVEIVAATKLKTAAADPKAIEVVIADVLQGYKVPVRRDIKILKSFTTHRLTFVRGTHRKEGLRFEVLVVRGDDGTFSIVHRRVVET